MCIRDSLQSETQLDRVLDGTERVKPAVLVLDSVQTAFVPDVGSTPGSVSQVREVAARLVLHAKATDRAVLLVGHVTKAGELAGPRTLEHIVDSVIYFEGSANPPFRVLRGQKNRFGSTGELGLFEMSADGLREVPEPSAALLADRPTGRPGTVVAAAMEGSRCLLLEVQARVAQLLGQPLPQRAFGGQLHLQACDVVRRVGTDRRHRRSSRAAHGPRRCDHAAGTAGGIKPRLARRDGGVPVRAAAVRCSPASVRHPRDG